MTGEWQRPEMLNGWGPPFEPTRVDKMPDKGTIVIGHLDDEDAARAEAKRQGIDHYILNRYVQRGNVYVAHLPLFGWT